MFPADLLLLSSSDEMGVCYVETSNLDGFFFIFYLNFFYNFIILIIKLLLIKKKKKRERNLKCKQSVETIRKIILEKESVKHLNGKIVYESPNNMIHHFKGMCYLNNDSEPLILNNNQVLLRVKIIKI